MEINLEPRSDEIMEEKQHFMQKFYTLLSGTIGKCLRLDNEHLRNFLSETFGTFLIVLFSCASIAQYKLALYDEFFNQNVLSINLSIGLSLSLAILVTGKTSGGHVNPAISFATLLIGKMSIKSFVIYVCGQLLGAFIAAFIVYVTYLDSLRMYPVEFYSIDTASIFATYPSSDLTVFGGFFGETLGTFLLVISYLTLVDKRNHELHWSFGAILMGMTLTIIGTSLGYKAAFAINPARDFSPRLFTLVAGWGMKTFTYANCFFIIPLIAPFIGAFVAVIK